MKAPSSTRRVNSASERNQYSRPFSSPGRCGRVVAEIATSSSGIRSTSPLISVPFPAPDGPVTTTTGLTASTAGVPGARRRSRSSPVVEQVDELGALTLGQPADGLRLADPALVEKPRGLDAPELRHRHQHVEHLRGRDVIGRIQEDRLDVHPTVLQVFLELGTADTDVVRTLEGFHPLIE